MNIKNLISEAEREFVKSIQRNLQEELKQHPSTHKEEDLSIDFDHIRIKAKLELCRKLLG